MIYTIVFVEKDKLRDTQLEKLLSDAEDESVLYSGDYKYIAQVKARSRPVLWGRGYYYEDKGLVACSKWKTIRGAQTAIKNMNLSSGLSVRGNQITFTKDDYAPVVYDITERWNKLISSKIEKEINSHKKKIANLTKKLG